jgi:hypothetical protein
LSRIGKHTQPKEWIMKRKEQSMLWASLLAMAVAGCSSTGINDSNATASNLGVSQGGGAGAVNNTSDSGTAASADDFSSYGSNSAATTGSGTAQAGTTSSSTPMTPNSTVTSIEVVQRTPDTTSGATTIGSTGTGTTGSSTTGDRMYRITLRMDDGTTQVVTQEWAPSFSTGDRVRTTSGAIQR